MDISVLYQHVAHLPSIIFELTPMIYKNTKYRAILRDVDWLIYISIKDQIQVTLINKYSNSYENMCS